MPAFEQTQVQSPRAKEPRLTGRQIVTIVIVVAVAAVLLPVGVQAAGQLVTIQDSSTTRKVRVDTKNRLTTVDMPATATPWHARRAASGLGTIFSVPAGKTTLIISSVTIDNNNAGLGVWYGTLHPECAGGSTKTLISAVLEPHTTAHFAYPQPIVLRPGGSNWCFKGTAPQGLSVVAVGYYY